MDKLFIFIVFLCHNQILISESRHVSNKWRNYPNSRPIIGILAQEVANISKNYSEGIDTYIAASYVKFVEAGGARVVPIHLNRTKDYLPEILDSINGVLIPGGGASLNDSLYAKTGKSILDYAIQKNQAGDFFPIWATCLGFELLANYLAPNYNNLVDCNASDIALPLILQPDASQSRLLSDLPSDILQSLTSQNVTANYHHKCLTPKAVKDSGLDQSIKVLSTNLDANNVEFVSTFETIKYPFYAVQWHPEKAPWEWNTDEMNLPHLPEAIQVTQYFALFLSNEGRKSTHHFEKKERENIELIYNIRPIYTGKNGSHFEQQYIFKTG